MSEFLRCVRFRLDLRQPVVMAIVNVTPDSFSGDGHDRHFDVALRHAERAVTDGAAILDIGGESSRPGAEPVSEQEEMDRVLPLLERIVDWEVPVSIDTVKPGVMRAAVAAGASMINDINAFQMAGALEAVAASDAALCVMHMRGKPQSMQLDPEYSDVVVEVRDYLMRQKDRCLEAGIAADRVTYDPGFGFGKSLAHNLALLRALPDLVPLGPLLIGVSRKSMVGAITGRPVGQRLAGSLATALMAADRGASIIRVHDVGETVDALRVRAAVLFDK